MSRTRGLWLARVALLFAIAALVPACGSVAGNKNPGVSGSAWVSTSGSGGGATPNGPIWNDPNTAPIGGSGGSGDLTYGTVTTPWNGKTKYPTAPNSNRPVYVTGALNTTEEYNIEGQVQGYRQTWLRQQNQGGGGGIGGIGGGVGFATLPALYISYNLRSVARARCKDLAMGNGAALESLGNRMTAAKLVFTAGTEKEYYATGADSATAYGAMGTAVQNQSLQGGWMGGGYWTDTAAGPYWGLVFCGSSATTGP